MNEVDHLESLFAKKPYLRLFADAEETSSGPYSLESSAQGLIVWTVSGGVRRALCSQKNPRKEAERLLPADKDRWTGTEIIVVLGLGNPALIDTLIPFLAQNQICIIFESSFTLAQILFHRGLLDPFLSRPGCHLFAGREMLEYLQTYLDSIPPDRIKGVRVIKHPPSVKLDTTIYGEVEDTIKSVLQAKISDLLTRFEFEKLWIRNIIANSRHLPAGHEPHSSGLSSWQNVLAGAPALLVAAGPSLRASLGLVRALQKKAFVICCDTAFKVLAKANILPHAVITLDAQRHTLLHLLGEPSIRSCVLFCDLVTHPDVLRYVDAQAVIFSSTAKIIPRSDGTLYRETTAGSAHSEQISGPAGDVQSGGSVATSAFDLLRTLGAGQIILIGQDLAYTGREIHSTGTHHNERWLTQISRITSLEGINERIVRKRSLIELPALQGGNILSDYVLNLYRQWFSDSIPSAGIPTVNLTGNGAWLNGAIRPESAEAFVDSLPERPELPSLFSGAQPLRSYEHPQNSELYANLKQSLESNSRALKDFLDRYPYLKAIGRRAEVYLKRNALRLANDERERIYAAKLEQSLRELERGLRPFFSKK